ncbi:MAG TPA: hypothetical protein VM686_40315 [Polyangiaceae bacterium]|jgi:colicin import membrane protein|nr:hypothetical protein [Polyangiaceae bacterium]
MAEQKESSVLFSLKELMSLEENRIRDEEADKERRAREEQERRASEDRAKRDAEERRIRDEEERRRAEEQRRREEEARVEAIKHGELAKAQAEAEHRARMEAMAAQQAHEQQLAALNSDDTKKRLKLYVGLAIGAVVLVGVGGGLAIKSANEEQAKKDAIHAAQLKETEEQLARLKGEFEAAQKKEESLQAALTGAKDEVEKERLKAELAKAKEQTQRAGAAVRGGGGGAKPSGGGAKPCNCPPGDPLCSCL